MWVSLKKKKVQNPHHSKNDQYQSQRENFKSIQRRDYNQKWHGNCQLNSHPERKGTALGYLHVSERKITANL